jgi:hypothetical protein
MENDRERSKQRHPPDDEEKRGDRNSAHPGLPSRTRQACSSSISVPWKSFG